MRDLGVFCKYHQQFGHDIDHCEEFYNEMERIMILCMLRLESAKKDVVIRMITCQDKKIEVCKYHPIIERPPMMILTKLTCINSGNYNALPYNYEHSFHIESPAPIFMLR